MDTQQLLDRLDDLLTKGRGIRLRPSEQQYIGGDDRLEPGQFADWRAQSLALLRSVLPDGHTYIAEFVDATAPARPNDPALSNRNAGVGIITALREDVDGGYLTNVRQLISGEIFSDFLEMAEHLANQGYYHAAAAVAGAVLEDALRRTLTDRGARATGNLESMNQIALDQGLYRAVVFKQVKVWIDVRNAAAHGNWDEVEPERVLAMIRDLPGFLAHDLSMA